MYINKPSVTKMEATDRVNLLHSTSSYPCPDVRHFIAGTKKLLLSDIEIKHQTTLLNQDRFLKNFACG